MPRVALVAACCALAIAILALAVTPFAVRARSSAMVEDPVTASDSRLAEPLLASSRSPARPATPSGGADVAPSRARTAPAQVPLSLLQLPASSVAALLVDIDGNRAYLYENLGGRLVHSADFYVAIGRGGPNKQVEGDEKTPVGIYFPNTFLEDSELPPIYGAGAFPLNYPNHWDRRKRRTGSGIWIHGSDKADGDLPPRSSRGCVALLNRDFGALRSDVQLGLTPIVLTRGVEWRAAYHVERLRRSLADQLEMWRRDWESRDVELYLSHYASDFRSGGMDRRAWAAHKRRVATRKTRIRVDLDQVAMFAYPGERDLFLVSFRQKYESNNFRATRQKQQYWRRSSDGWRIVQEG